MIDRVRLCRPRRRAQWRWSLRWLLQGPLQLCQGDFLPRRPLPIVLALPWGATLPWWGVAVPWGMALPLARAEKPRSEDSVSFGAVAEVDAEPAARNAVDATAAGTVVSIADRQVQPEDMNELLLEVPGAHLARSGGAGASAILSLRGADFGHTALVIGDVPLIDPGTGLLDLSLFRPEAFASMEVYRGGGPAWLSAGALGGVVRLIPRTHNAARGRLQSNGFARGGSFGSYAAGLDASSAGRRGDFLAQASVDGSRNNYSYRFDNATGYDAEDDGELMRRNADTMGMSALLHSRLRVHSKGSLTVLALGFSRAGGAPGPGASFALQARRHDAVATGAVAYEVEDRRGRLQIAAGSAHQRQRFSDPFGEIGLGRQATDDRFHAFYGRLAGSLHLTPFLEGTAVGWGSYHRYAPDNALASAAPASQRWLGSGLVEARFHGSFGRRRRSASRASRSSTAVSTSTGTAVAIPADSAVATAVATPAASRTANSILAPSVSEALVPAAAHPVSWSLRPSVRFEASRTQAQDNSLGQGQGAAPSTQLLPTYRLGARLSPMPWLSLVGSIYSGRRLPTVLELFGNQGALGGNPTLEPESGWGVDGGAVLKGKASRIKLEGELEMRGFSLRMDDLIRYVQTSQFTSVAQNLASASVRGLEAGGRGAFGRHWVATGALTYLRTRDGFGNELNWRPRLRAQAAVELHSRSLGGGSERFAFDDAMVGATAVHRGAYFNDPANFVRLPAATWVGLSGRLACRVGHDGLLALEVSAQDVGDRRGQDFLGFPLPGRRYWGGLRYGVAMD